MVSALAFVDARVLFLEQLPNCARRLRQIIMRNPREKQMMGHVALEQEQKINQLFFNISPTIGDVMKCFIDAETIGWKF